MNKVKSTPVPLPGSKSKAKAQATPSKQPLSNEFVGDSDDSDTEATPQAPSTSEKPAKSKKKKPVEIAVHRPKTNGSAKKTPIPPPTQKAAAKRAAPSKPQAESSSSDDSSDESPESAERVEKEKEATSAANQGNGNANTSSSSSESSSDSEDEVAPSAPQPRAEAPRQTQSHTVEFRPVTPFVPPKGFVEVPTPLNASMQAVKILEKLEGKQIWHITAPAGVSISHLQEVAMDQALSGSAILSHKGINYGFTAGEKNEQGERQVLIPRGNGFKAVPSPISRTLHLQQVVRLPKLSTQQAESRPGSSTALPITASTIRAPRAQVKGLKMRYFHSGFGDEDPGTIGSSDSETEAPAPASMGVPNEAPVLNKPEKRKHDDERTDAPAKKHKKYRTPEELKKREEKRAKKQKDKVKWEA